MASKPKKDAVAVTSHLNVTLLLALVAATVGPVGYMYVSGIDAEPLAAAGFAEINKEVTDASGNFATRATPAGVAKAAELSPPAPAAGFAGAFAPQEPTAPVVKASVSSFKIVTGVPVPASQRGTVGDKKYPFDSLPVGGSFFVAASTEMPDPVKKISSSVSSATGRYAVPHATATRVNKAGETVPKMVPVRQFVIRAIEDGAAWGFTGMKGAAIFRTA